MFMYVSDLSCSVMAGRKAFFFMRNCVQSILLTLMDIMPYGTGRDTTMPILFYKKIFAQGKSPDPAGYFGCAGSREKNPGTCCGSAGTV